MPREHRPWTFAAVCIMAPALTLLVFRLSQVPVIELLPGYVTAFLFVGGLPVRRQPYECPTGLRTQS
jgi:hypothetical protein